jgi:predicted transcriptional regulator
MERINGRKVKQLILDLGLNVNQVAELAKCKPSTVARLMQGKTCRIGTLSRVAKVLGINGLDLLQED